MLELCSMIFFTYVIILSVFPFNDYLIGLLNIKMQTREIKALALDIQRTKGLENTSDFSLQSSFLSFCSLYGII